MANPTMPNIPGIGAMTDTIDFVKNLWGSMGIPGTNMSGMNIPGMNLPNMVMPTLSVEEIQKKITDLKAVESWLNLNMGMLRSTIQALEVQAATLSTLQSMGQSFTASMNAVTRPQEQQSAAPASANGSNGSAIHSEEKPHSPLEPTSKDERDAAALTAPLMSAAAWWNMLQEQFKQAVGNAMASETSATAAEKPKAKPKEHTTPAAASTTGTGASGTTRKRKTSK